MKLILFFTLLTNLTLIQAKTLKGITFPETVIQNSEKLILNGVGIRKATWFRVKVYIAGLYLKKKSKDYNKFLSNKQTKYLKMHFVRSVGAKKLQDGWEKAISNVLKENNEVKKQISPYLKKFLTYIEDVKKGDIWELLFLKDRVIFSYNGKMRKPISDSSFSRILLSAWFINPQDENLKVELLGK